MAPAIGSNQKDKGCFPDVSSEKKYSLLLFCVSLGDVKNVLHTIASEVTYFFFEDFVSVHFTKCTNDLS